MDLLKFPGPELNHMGILLRDVLGFNKASFIIVDTIDDCKKSDRGIILRMLRDVMASFLRVVKLFLAVRQGMFQEVGSVFKSSYEATTSSSEAYLSIREYIKDVLAEKGRTRISLLAIMSFSVKFNRPLLKRLMGCEFILLTIQFLY